MPNPKPTREQIDAARNVVQACAEDAFCTYTIDVERAVNVLLAATEPPPEPATSESDRVPDTLPWALRICRTKLLPWLEDLDRPLGDAPAALRIVLSAMPPAPPSDEQLAEEAARFADERLGGEPFSSGDVEMIQEEARGGALHKVTKWGHFAVGYFLGRREGRQ